MAKHPDDWTLDFPLQAARASEILGVEISVLRTHGCVKDLLVHAWTPGRGGPQAVIGLDSTFHAVGSSWTATALRQAYEQGARTDHDALTDTPIQHALPGLVRRLITYKVIDADAEVPAAPSEELLERLLATPLEAAQESRVAAAVETLEQGEVLVLGLDRVEGPGHYYVVVRMSGRIFVNDPTAEKGQAVSAWPPPNAAARTWSFARIDARQRAVFARVFTSLGGELAQPDPDPELLVKAATILLEATIKGATLPEGAERRAIDGFQAAERAGLASAGRTWTEYVYHRRRSEFAAAAVECVDRRCSAEDEDGSAHVLRAWMRGAGFGYPVDTAEMLADLMTSVERDNADAHFELSVLYNTGQRGVEVDEASSINHLIAAADRGQHRALYNAAARYATGDGVPKDAAKAYGLYVRAAESGNPRAAYTAGVMALTGEGVAIDVGGARKHFWRAIDLGFDLRAVAAHSPIGDRIIEVMRE